MDFSKLDFSLTAKISEKKLSFSDRYELFRGFGHSWIGAVCGSIYTHSKNNVELAQLFMLKLEDLVIKDKKYPDISHYYTINWGLIHPSKAEKENLIERACYIARSTMFIDMPPEKKRTAGDADSRETTANNLLVKELYRFSFDQNNKELHLHNIFLTLYKGKSSLSEMRLVNTEEGLRKLEKNDAEEPLKEDLIKAVEETYREDVTLKKIVALEKLILRKICGIDRSEKDIRTQFNEFEAAVKTQNPPQK